MSFLTVHRNALFLRLDIGTPPEGTEGFPFAGAQFSTAICHGVDIPTGKPWPDCCTLKPGSTDAFDADKIPQVKGTEIWYYPVHIESVGSPHACAFDPGPSRPSNGQALRSTSDHL